MKYILWLFVLPLCLTTVRGEVTKGNEEPKVLFHRNLEGYASFRIPAIIQTRSGRIIAFAEARRKPSDTGDIDLVMKYSDDGGNTWSETRIIWGDKGNTCGNPSPVVDRATGRIILLSTWNRGEDSEKEIKALTGFDVRRPHVIYSDDDGITWSEPRRLDNVRREEWTWYATGPCHAVQLRNKKYRGRIVVPCNHVVAGAPDTHRSHVIYSDDSGQTWQLGGIVEQTGGNESSVVELGNGDLVLNMRNKNRDSHKCRAYAVSKDGGITWSEMRYEPQLEEPRCQGSIINYTLTGKPGKTLLFSNPADPDKRVNMTIKKSVDNGRTWQQAVQVYPGASAYSDMVVLNNGDVAIFYEFGDNSPYDKMGFRVYPASLLMK